MLFFGIRGGGRVTRAIVIHELYTKQAIIENTHLTEAEFDQAVKALSEDNLLEIRENETLWVIKELYGNCKKYFKAQQENLILWVENWRKEKGIKQVFDTKMNHFFIADRLLPEFTENLIEHAKEKILLTNPYVKRCHLCQSLIDISKKGIIVKLFARDIDSAKFRNELTKSLILRNDDSIHAKLTVVDSTVAIVSSMNLYAGSTAGQSWEAGIVTIDRNVVSSIHQSILKKFQPMI